MCSFVYNFSILIFILNSYRFYDLPPDLHHNMYWSYQLPTDQTEKKFPGDLNWQEWQLTGNDSESLWQDPLFEDPSTHRYILFYSPNMSMQM